MYTNIHAYKVVIVAVVSGDHKDGGRMSGWQLPCALTKEAQWC